MIRIHKLATFGLTLLLLSTLVPLAFAQTPTPEVTSTVTSTMTSTVTSTVPSTVTTAPATLPATGGVSVFWPGILLAVLGVLGVAGGFALAQRSR